MASSKWDSAWQTVGVVIGKKFAFPVRLISLAIILAVKMLLRFAAVTLLPIVLYVLPPLILDTFLPLCCGFVIGFTDEIYIHLSPDQQATITGAIDYCRTGLAFLDRFVDVTAVTGVFAGGVGAFLVFIVFVAIIKGLWKIFINWLTVAAPAVAAAIV